MMNLVTCKRCHDVFFEISRASALEEVEKFNKYYNTLTPEQQEDYYNSDPADLKAYERCRCGNSYKHFRPAKPNDCSDGVTISPIIRKKD